MAAQRRFSVLFFHFVAQSHRLKVGLPAWHAVPRPAVFGASGFGVLAGVVARPH